jgi:hypothetical protein
MVARKTPWNSVRWLDCYNGSGQTIPAYSVAQIQSVDVFGVPTVVQVQNDNQDPTMLVFTGPTPIPDKTYGICTRDWPAYAAYTTTDATPVTGTTWGPKKGDWTLRKANSGFTIWGGAFRNIVLAVASTPGPQGFTGTISQTIICTNGVPAWTPGSLVYSNGMLQTVDGSSGQGGTGPISTSDTGDRLDFSKPQNSQYIHHVA